MPKRICRMCGEPFNPLGRWDDPNVCQPCLREDFCAGPAPSGYEPEPARALVVRGTARGADLAHNQDEAGATPAPATNLPAPCVTATVANCERPPAGNPPPPDQPRSTPPGVSSNISIPVVQSRPLSTGPASVFSELECDAVQTEWWALLAAASHVRQAEILTNPTGQSARRLAHWAVALAEARS